MSFKIGVDVGGTFTDLFVWSVDGAVETYKTLSTPGDPSVGVLDGLRRVAQTHGLSLADLAGRISAIVHGTTVTTNATLTRGGAATGLITPAGVRDALEIRRGIREEPHDNRCENVVPLVPRHLRRCVRGRLDARGEETTALEPADVEAALEVFRAEGVDAIAICFMNSFANPAHEEAAAELVRASLPDTFLSVSSHVLPTVRFYDRVSTTVLNAYVGPILRDYLGSLTSKLADIGFGGALLIMQSNGGVALPEVTIGRPAGTLLSGPAAGPAAAVAYTRTHGGDDCILVDMGGTSFDASLVRNGVAAMSKAGEIERLRIALPMLQITTIGAGGGSIGWIDDGGLLRMGPQSASAAPGPACYGRGGTLPTCTDANVVLGYLDPTYFAGGALDLDASRAKAAIDEHVAGPLGVDREEAAAGMYRVITSNMAHGVREVTVKRGLDPREFPMVVAGGAAGLHACAIAEELDMPTVLVPATASVLCAAGMLLSELQHDFVRSYVTRLQSMDSVRLLGLIDEMVGEGASQLGLEGVDESRMQHEVQLDLRYVKQFHEVTVTVPRAAVEQGDLAQMAAALHVEHNRLYGYDLGVEGTELELINVRVRSRGMADRPDLPTSADAGPDAEGARKGSRRAFRPETGSFDEVPVYDGHALRTGNTIDGPALIEQSDTTLYVSGSFTAHVDTHHSYLLTRRES